MKSRWYRNPKLKNEERENFLFVVRSIVENDFRELIRKGEKQIESKFIKAGSYGGSCHFKEQLENILSVTSHIESEIRKFAKSYKGKLSVKDVGNIIDAYRLQLFQQSTNMWAALFQKHDKENMKQLYIQIKNEFTLKLKYSRSEADGKWGLTLESINRQKKQKRFKSFFGVIKKTISWGLEKWILNK